MYKESKLAEAARASEHVTLTVNGVRGITLIAKGIMLCNKKDKTEEEVLAANEFKLYMKIVMTIISLFTLVSLFVVVRLVSNFNGGSLLNSYIERSGKYIDGRVCYIQDTEKYTTLEELGISESQVKEGDRISLYFDYDENLVFGNTYTDESKKSIVSVSLLFADILGFTGALIVLSIAMSKSSKFIHFREWYETVM